MRSNLELRHAGSYASCVGLITRLGIGVSPIATLKGFSRLSEVALEMRLYYSFLRARLRFGLRHRFAAFGVVVPLRRPAACVPAPLPVDALLCNAVRWLAMPLSFLLTVQ